MCALALGLSASACEPSLQQLSAGRGGGAPEMIQITNRETHPGWTTGSVTWTATCPGGQTYYCSNVSTTQMATVVVPGSAPGTAFATSSQVTCTPAAAAPTTPPSSAASAAP